MKKTIAFLSLALLMSFFQQETYAQEVFKWVDPDGVTHYGDESRTVRQNGAKPINIDTPKKIGTVNVTPPSYTPQKINVRNNNNDANTNYIISIVSPTQNQQVRANTGTMNVVTSITPRPKTDFSLKVFIDNSLYASANNTNRIELQGISKGEHTIQVKMVQKNGKIFASSTNKFVVLRAQIRKK